MDGSLKVLLVEHDSEQAHRVASCLRDFNSQIEIDSAYSGEACLKHLSENKYEVIIIAHDYIVKDSSYLSVLPKVVQKTLESKSSNGKAKANTNGHSDTQNLILKSKRRLQTMFDSIQDTIYEVNPHFEIVMANKKSAEHCSSEPEDLIGKKCYAAYFDLKKPCETCPVKATLENFEPNYVDRRSGNKIYEMSSYPILTDDGKLESVAVHSKDVTERKLLEKSLIQTEKLSTIGILTSGIAHELRNPLNIIETARYYIEEFMNEGNADIKDKLDIIRRSVRRAAKIINDLLEFSRTSEEEKERINIETLLDNTMSLLGKELCAKNIDFSVKCDEEPIVFFNVDSLKQVLLNLIINAIQSMQGSGKLQVEISKNAGLTEIAISDTGVGIPETDLPRIFSPFFTTKEVGEGTGLGLYISHIIIEREGGKISVDSKVGKGTTFKISLPSDSRCE